MSHLHVSPNLLLTHQELSRLDLFTQGDGLELSRRLLTGTPGLLVPTGQEWLVSLDVPADQTLQVGAGFGLDAAGRLLRTAGVRGLELPLPDTWYLVKVAYATSSLEPGLVSIGANGQLVGDADCRFADVLRGMPGVPTLIRLLKADGSPALNGGYDHEIQDVLDDQHAVLSTVGLVAESGLRYQVVGAFQFGWQPAAEDELIYRYDDVQVFLIPEAVDPNTVLPAGYDPATAFSLARVRRRAQGVDIEDKRGPIWLGASEATLGSLRAGEALNPLLAVERLFWPLAGTPRAHSIAVIGFGLTASAWSLDPSARQLTLTQGAGGAYQSLADADADDFVGWWVTRAINTAYDTPGVEPRWRITAASKPTPTSLRLQLDGVDPADLADTSRALLLVPDAEQVHFYVRPQEDFGYRHSLAFSSHAVAQGFAELELPCAGEPRQYYVEYCFSTGKRQTAWRPIGRAPYYDENQADEHGRLLPTAQRSPIRDAVGYVAVLPAPDGYETVLQRVDLGDLPGVENRSITAAVIALPLLVGQNRTYQRLSCAGTFTQDQYLDLRPTRAGNLPLRNGNQFTLELSGPLDLDVHALRLTIGYANPASPGTVLYDFSARDVRAIGDGGLWVTAVYDGTQWRCFVHRRTEYPIGTILAIGRVGSYNPLSKFDLATGLGFGEWDSWALADTRNGTENCAARTLVGYDYQGDVTAPQSSLGQRDATTGQVLENYAAVGNEGGENDHLLTVAETPSHDHVAEGQAGPYGYNQVLRRADFGQATTVTNTDGINNGDGGEPDVTSTRRLAAVGGDKPHENRMKYRVVLFAQKIS